MSLRIRYGRRLQNETSETREYAESATLPELWSPEPRGAGNAPGDVTRAPTAAVVEQTVKDRNDQCRRRTAYISVCKSPLHHRTLVLGVFRTPTDADGPANNGKTAMAECDNTQKSVYVWQR